MPTPAKPFSLLGSVRRSLRVLNAAIETACRESGLTMQQQAFLLALAAHPGRRAPLSDIRVELLMDQATASELLARLTRLRLVRRHAAADRRALEIVLTPGGRARLVRSIERTRHEIQRAESRGELAALRDSLAAYLDYYVTAPGGVRPAAATPTAPRRGAGPARARAASRTLRAGA